MTFDSLSTCLLKSVGAAESPCIHCIFVPECLDTHHFVTWDSTELAHPREFPSMSNLLLARDVGRNNEALNSITTQREQSYLHKQVLRNSTSSNSWDAQQLTQAPKVEQAQNFRPQCSHFLRLASHDVLSGCCICARERVLGCSAAEIVVIVALGVGFQSQGLGML